MYLNIDILLNKKTLLRETEKEKEDMDRVDEGASKGGCKKEGKGGEEG